MAFLVRGLKDGLTWPHVLIMSSDFESAVTRIKLFSQRDEKKIVSTTWDTPVEHIDVCISLSYSVQCSESKYTRPTAQLTHSGCK